MYGEPRESLIDRQIREAQERGEFDDLPGKGKPLAGLDKPYDGNWWLKDLLKREDLSYPLPTSLALRKEIQDLPQKVADVRSEATVREMVADLNGRISESRRKPIDGPPVVLEPVDVDAIVQAWRDRRGGGGPKSS
jgi:Domain of unknown function (DUF1992)